MLRVAAVRLKGVRGTEMAGWGGGGRKKCNTVDPFRSRGFTPGGGEGMKNMRKPVHCGYT